MNENTDLLGVLSFISLVGEICNALEVSYAQLHLFDQKIIDNCFFQYILSHDSSEIIFICVSCLIFVLNK